MVQGERVIGAGVATSQGGSWARALLGDSFDTLYELLEDICTGVRWHGAYSKLSLLTVEVCKVNVGSVSVTQDLGGVV
jgi:hypothetical protein